VGCLRLWLALCVVIFHLIPGAAPTLDGRLAVESFILISGFFMALVLDTRYQGRLGVFYLNRFLRIYPLYWVVLALAVLLASWVLYRMGYLGPILSLWIQFLPQFKPSSAWLLVLSQLFLVSLPWIFLLDFRAPDGALHLSATPNAQPLPAYPFTIIRPAWSLGIEDLFYLMAPAITACPDGLLLVLAALSGGAKAWSCFGRLNYDPWTFMFAGFEIFFFVAGILSYRLYAALKAGGRLGDRMWKALAVLACLAVVTTPWMHVADSVAWIPLALALALGLPGIHAWGSGRSWDRALGDISYPLYLIHQVVLMVFESPLFSGVSKGLLRAMALPWCLLAAWALHRVVEGPVNRLRRRLLAR
jgi:peptidoglycan/LPS O-acetylase OafA/YrhL